MERIYADKQGTAVFRCPHCLFERRFDASSYRDRDSRITIKCQCGERIPVLIEFREFYRKSVNLLGRCTFPTFQQDVDVQINDISMTGASITVEFKHALADFTAHVGDVVTLEFHLDNPSRDLIRRRAEVCNINGSQMGVRFARSEYDKELGFYLLR